MSCKFQLADFERGSYCLYMQRRLHRPGRKLRALRRWFIQKRDRLGCVHKLWIWNILLNTSRHVCRGVPRVSRQLKLAGRQHRGGELRVQRRVRSV
jgi:hypothetical protein